MRGGGHEIRIRIASRSHLDHTSGSHPVQSVTHLDHIRITSGSHLDLWPGTWTWIPSIPLNTLHSAHTPREGVYGPLNALHSDTHHGHGMSGGTVGMVHGIMCMNYYPVNNL